MTISRLSVLAVLSLACTMDSGALRKSDAADCGSQKSATVALGDALGHVRQARLFAETAARRLALARLEAALVERIQAEPDSNFRGAAWLQAEGEYVLKFAESERDRIEQWTLRAPTVAQQRQSRDEEYTREYRSHMSTAVKLLDPRSPKGCAARHWQLLYTAALEAEAR